MKILPLPYKEAKLRKFCDHLIERAAPEHRELDRIDDDDRLPSWAGFIQDAGIRYQTFDLHLPKLDDSSSDIVREELRELQKLSSKAITNQTKLVKGLNQLSDDSRGMLSFGGIDTRIDLDDTVDQIRKSENPLHQLEKTTRTTLKYFNKPRGRDEDIELLEFTLELTDIYTEATGGKIGRGFSDSIPDYKTHLENFLLMCITPLRPNTTIDSVRKLIRKVQKHKNPNKL